MQFHSIRVNYVIYVTFVKKFKFKKQTNEKDNLYNYHASILMFNSYEFR